MKNNYTMEKARNFDHYKWKYGNLDERKKPKKKATPKKKSKGRGKLVAKKITDKRGHVKTVWVNPFGDHLKYRYSRGHVYRDKEGNTIKIIGIDKKAFIVSTLVKKKGGRKETKVNYHIKYLDTIIDKKI